MTLRESENMRAFKIIIRDQLYVKSIVELIAKASEVKIVDNEEIL